MGPRFNGVEDLVVQSFFKVSGLAFNGATL